MLEACILDEPYLLVVTITMDSLYKYGDDIAI
jgi:hypothetical protein